MEENSQIKVIVTERMRTNFELKRFTSTKPKLAIEVKRKPTIL